MNYTATRRRMATSYIKYKSFALKEERKKCFRIFLLLLFSFQNYIAFALDYIYGVTPSYGLLNFVSFNLLILTS